MNTDFLFFPAGCLFFFFGLVFMVHFVFFFFLVFSQMLCYFFCVYVCVIIIIIITISIILINLIIHFGMIQKSKTLQARFHFTHLKNFPELSVRSAIDDRCLVLPLHLLSSPPKTLPKRSSLITPSRNTSSPTH